MVDKTVKDYDELRSLGCSETFIQSYFAAKKRLDAPRIKVGSTVSWKWSTGKAVGTVDKIHTEPFTLKISGVILKRKCSPEDPCLEISHVNKDRKLKLLKLVSEVNLEQN